MQFDSVSAIIEEDVSIGDGSMIWYFAHLMEGVKLGLNCSIGEKTFLGKGVIIGDDVRIGNSVNIYDGAIIKNRVFIGNNTSFTNVRTPRIGKPSKFLDTIVEDDVSIGANATIVAGVKLGKGCVIADGAVVVGNIPPMSFAHGNPARIKIR